MTKHTLIRRTRVLAALWLLALAAMATADRAERSCPLSAEAECPSQQSDPDCGLELFKLAALPIRLHHSPTSHGLPSAFSLDPLDVPSAEHAVSSDETVDTATEEVLAFAPKNSPPFFA